MGKTEKLLVLGFVAALAATSGVAHYYVTKEGYAMVATRSAQRREAKAASRKQQQQEEDEEQMPTRRVPGGVWGNIAKRRDALGKD
jgi:hypothetical protein